MTQHGLSTTAVHAGSERPNPHHSLTVPVTQTATYTFSDTQDLCDFMDARMWGMEGAHRVRAIRKPNRRGSRN